MDENNVPFHVVGEENAEWELAWRRMRLFPSLCGCSWFLSCPCFACTAFGTCLNFFLFYITGSWVLAFCAIVSLFSVGWTLYACVSRKPLPCWRPRWRCVARFVALCLFFLELVLLVGSACDLWEFHELDSTGRPEGIMQEGGGRLASVITVFGVVGLLIGVALVVVSHRATREFRRQREELKDVRIRWVKVEAFKKWREEGRIIPRFQDLGFNDYIEEDMDRSFSMWLLRTRYVVSHAWLTAAHPDPLGVKLDSLLCELAKCSWWKFWKRIVGCYDVVFFDYASLPQNGPNGQKRNDEEQELFKKALNGMNILYSHSSFQVLVIPDVPEGRQYKDRGWCYTELAISTAHGRVINNFWRSEVRRLIKQEEMPVFPNTFYRKFQGKEFTNKGDRAVTMKIYSEYFKHVESQVTYPARLVYVMCVTFPGILILTILDAVLLIGLQQPKE